MNIIKPTCAATDCGKPVLARGLCAAHYHAAYRAGTLPPRQPRERQGKHSLTDIDTEALTAICATCGPVRVRVRTGGGRGRYECRLGNRNAPGRKKKPTSPAVRRRERLKLYGLREGDYEIMLLFQGGRCAICYRAVVPLVIDHCHVTGRVRGLLCNRCNLGLGHLGDAPDHIRSALAYLLSA